MCIITLFTDKRVSLIKTSFIFNQYFFVLCIEAVPCHEYTNIKAVCALLCLRRNATQICCHINSMRQFGALWEIALPNLFEIRSKTQYGSFSHRNNNMKVIYIVRKCLFHAKYYNIQWVSSTHWLLQFYHIISKRSFTQ